MQKEQRKVKIMSAIYCLWTSDILWCPEIVFALSDKSKLWISLWGKEPFFTLSLLRARATLNLREHFCESLQRKDIV